MRRVLLDTHAFLWWLTDNKRLGEVARQIIADSGNEVFVSAATVWEISIKRALGKLQAPINMDAIVEDEGFINLPVSSFHGEQAGLLPAIHKDPFDRMLVAQAQAEGLEILTQDSHIPKYAVRVISAIK